jgi:hypothetical protein
MKPTKNLFQMVRVEIQLDGKSAPIAWNVLFAPQETDGLQHQAHKVHIPMAAHGQEVHTAITMRRLMSSLLKWSRKATITSPMPLSHLTRVAQQIKDSYSTLEQFLPH